jgi:uncharacterized membrane protein SirB2
MNIDVTPHLQTAYPHIKHLHVTMVMVSGLLFVARSVGVMAGHLWPMRPAIKKCSVAIDVVLLSAGVSLWVALQLNPLRDTWLGVKLTLLMAYIVFGSVAMRRGRTRLIRGLAICLSVCLYASMVGLAIMHHPLGWMSLWMQP